MKALIHPAAARVKLAYNTEMGYLDICFQYNQSKYTKRPVPMRIPVSTMYTQMMFRHNIFPQNLAHHQCNTTLIGSHKWN